MKNLDKILGDIRKVTKYYGDIANVAKRQMVFGPKANNIVQWQNKLVI